MLKKTKVANLLLLDYSFLFILLTLIIVGVSMLVVVLSGTMAKSEPETMYTASQVIKNDLATIDTTDIVNHGGGIQVIDSQYEIVVSKGLDTFHKERLSKEEFTEFLINSGKIDGQYHYSIAHNSEQDFWLVVVFPVDLKIQLITTFGSNMQPQHAKTIQYFIIVLALGYLLILLIGLLIYSRLTSKSFVRPLKKLLTGVKSMIQGDYTARVALDSINEFGELKDAFNQMAEKIESETTLREAAEANRKRLILDISHDLKNPLSSIMGYAELAIKNPNLSEADRNTYSSIIFNNSVRANNLIEDLFGLSMMESPEFQLQKVKVDICEYLREQLASMIPQLEQAGFIYKVEIPEERIPMAIDTKQMDRVFSNILTNAVHYNTVGTLISVSLRNERSKVVIVLEDDGIGLPKGMADEIFEPFTRVAGVGNSSMGGTGLGLAITKMIILKHGGDIRLETDDHQGCRFIIEFNGLG